MIRHSQNLDRGPNSRMASTSNEQIITAAKINDWTGQAKQISSTIVEKLESSIQARPLTCLGIAAGLGVLAAFWSKRK